MYKSLTSSEKRFLQTFIESTTQNTPASFSYLYVSVISILGLVLFSSAVIITLNNMNERIVFWVFFPGTIGGMGIILFSFFLLKYIKKMGENRKLASIIKKLLKNES